MTSYSALDLSQLPAWEQGSDSSFWWGVAVLIAAVSAVYAALIASYFYLRQSATVWPPMSIGAPALLWPVVATALRTLSEPLMFVASKEARSGNRGRILVTLGASIILLTAWMIETVEYAFSRSFGWTFGTYESVTWALEAFAFVAAGVLVIWGLVVWFWVWQGHISVRRRAGLQVLKMAWTSQFISWIFIWLVVYFGPRVFSK